MALPILRHRIIVNHRAVGDSITSADLIARALGRIGKGRRGMSTQFKAGSSICRALAALERMRFTTRHRIEGSYSGCHTSRQQGGAGEFVDYREYSGSEDLRRLDWKVLGRTGKAFVPIHEEETNLLCTLALDASGSMDFRGIAGTADASGSKLQYAQYLATRPGPRDQPRPGPGGAGPAGPAVAVDAAARGDRSRTSASFMRRSRRSCRGPRPVHGRRACGSCSSAPPAAACCC